MFFFVLQIFDLQMVYFLTLIKQYDGCQSKDIVDTRQYIRSLGGGLNVTTLGEN